MSSHRKNELRSLAFHREVARRLEVEPEILERARLKATQWCEEWDTASAPYAQRWLTLLEGPRERLIDILTVDSEEARELRQTTPFAGALPPRERWRIWRSVA